jgi:hypothetical protein
MNSEEMAQLADPNFLGHYLAGLPWPRHIHGPTVSVREDNQQRPPHRHQDYLRDHR